MPNRTFNSPDYRYGFNGKEKDESGEWGNLTHYDYGFRIYNPGIGRFLSVDPITRDYPELTPYQFASNTPIQAIDLDGLEAYFIHGTQSDSERWVHPNDQDEVDLTLVEGLTAMSRSFTYDYSFEWTEEVSSNKRGTKTRKRNYIFNDEKDRNIAAQNLVTHILETRNDWETVTLIGHSHGGNVAIQAAQILQDEHDIIADVISIATPAFNKEKGKENAIGLKGIHLHIYNNIDGVDGMARGSERFKNGTTINLGIKANAKYKSSDMVGAHSFDANFPNEFFKAVNEALRSNKSLKEGIEQNKNNQEKRNQENEETQNEQNNGG